MSQLQHVESLTEMTPLQIRSHRRAQWFWIDNAVIDVHAKALGPIGIALYVGLCRYANSQTGRCWPSLERLSRQLGISHMTASRYLKTLVACGLIHVEPRPGTTALITILDIPESPLTDCRVDEDPPHRVEGPPSQGGGTPLTDWREPDLRNQTQEPDPPTTQESAHTHGETHPRPPRTPSVRPLPQRPDDALLPLDVSTRATLEVRARAALLAEGVRVDHLIRPVLETRMLALWEAQRQAPGVPQRQGAAA